MPRSEGTTPKRVDANQPAIVKALRQRGCSVLPIHALGRGAPDLLVGFLTSTGERRNVLLELKVGHALPTPAEVDFALSWIGPYALVNSIEGALAAISREAGYQIKPERTKQ